ncbi:MAG: Ig-like domain-containing protein [Thermoanaerobaculia bacterium]
MKFRPRTFGALSAALVLIAGAACSRKPATIDISPKKVTIYGLERAQRLNVRILDKKGSPLESRSPSWTSSDQSTAHVDEGGRVVAKKAGKAMITASLEGVSGQVPVEVVDVSAIEFGAPELPLVGPAGTAIPLSFRVLDSKQSRVDLPPTWTSADPKIATVSEKGVVTSVGEGKTNIVARIGDVQGACEVRVSLRTISRLELRPATALVRVGDSQKFVVTAFGPDGQAIPEVAATFQSSDPAVASVGASGVATGHKAGAATIKVQLAGAAAEASLLVN